MTLETRIEWYANGTKASEAMYRDGIRHGEARDWFEDGAPMFEGMYYDGRRHGTFFEFYEDGQALTGGWIGVMPGARVEQDLAELKQLTDAYFAARGQDPTLYRKLICKGTDDTVPEFRRQPACSGVSFYGPPVYRDSSQRSINFIAGLFEEFLGAYLDQIALRADDSFTAADLIAQEDMRRRWLIDQLFSDPYATNITPFEVWTFQNAPPEIKF